MYFLTPKMEECSLKAPHRFQFDFFMFNELFGSYAQEWALRVFVDRAVHCSGNILDFRGGLLQVGSWFIASAVGPPGLKEVQTIGD